MTKHFCDLCGEPAAENMPSLRVVFPNMTWSGTKHQPHSIGATDGTWTPFVEGRIVFDAHEMPRMTSAYHPDLCKACIAMLLRKMAEVLK